ncbi:DUF58 domain-containing protein [Beijerinckia indica]|uniref:DUF58 domain-containing protein n=1 Tax=Beijerinckia indica subsp. indica (strain ATCC 9039 / DSM 1715 / NCIMB 8712) TaxID=395963 RepID=B2IKD1_BEII9|nr:DUF58 domain-containing protein [Beijerinckia indica]ACB96412.1 protein of unknown function DUF58 [Beijerinckia indica subsp. indica ATCC 9039]
MPTASLLDPALHGLGPSQQDEALRLAARFPGLIVAARDIAASVMHGVHGRRRPGTGETFWQFRPFTVGESAARIDWRRSARDQNLYVREREWEAAHTIYLWVDRSASMYFLSSLAMQSKVDRALVLGLAAADLLVAAGERVALLGLTRPLATRQIVERLAEAWLLEEKAPDYRPAELPEAMSLPRGAQALLIGDFLCDVADLARVIERLSAQGANGHLVMIADPIEETFPFKGHAELIDVDSPARFRVGQAEDFAQDYQHRLAAHRDAIAALTRAKGWSLSIHRTDHPASEALLALRMRLEAGGMAVTAREG